jgi:single-stranded DNA-specific DHH superfamily exonuclease
MNAAKWEVHPPRPEADALAAALSIPLPIARVLVIRKILTAEAARAFLYGGLGGLHDPYMMKGMDRAVGRVLEAIARGEKILVFGDYDVDGVLSTVMLIKALTTLGADVSYFIPERLTDGYGIKDGHVDIPVQRGAGLVISVDCGVKAVEFTARAKAKGIDVIITDHHRPGEALPDAVAVLDPVLPDSGYPDGGLAGVGVTFKLIQALLEKGGKGAGLPHYMKLVSIGTVADVAELKGENRLFVKFGLEGLRNVANMGLRNLIEACERIEKRELDRRYKCLVLGSPEWHRGVIGIVASKLKDRFNRPVVLFAYEDGKASGSGRSIPDVPLIDLLEDCRHLFLSYGGHRLAVGCTLAVERMAEFRETLNPLADARIAEDSLTKKIKIDGPLEFAAVDERFLEAMALLVPFGVGNPKPLFMAENVEVISDPQLLQRKHVKFLARQNGRVLEVLGWDKSDLRNVLRRGSRVKLAFSLMTSEYLGERKVSLSIEDLKT